MVRIALLLVAIGLFGSSQAAAQGAGREAAPNAILRGFITDRSSGRPLPGANVVLLRQGAIVRGAAANGDGFYQIASIVPSRYTLRVSFIGYETYQDTLRLASGTRTVSVALTPVRQQLEGVTVEAREYPVVRAETGLRRIRPAEIERIPTPGPGGDLAAYLRSLPGVMSIGDRGGRLYVRGGTPTQNLILVDGTPIYKPFHIIGLYSAFPSYLVSNVNFYAGGFSARYMGRISSVLDVELRAGNLKQYAGRAAVGPFITSVGVEGPIRRGEASFLLHYRQSLIEHTAPFLLGEPAPYYFYDLVGKVHTQGSRSQCSFTLMRTYDRGRIDPESASVLRWTNTTAGAQCLAFGASAQVFNFSFGASHFGNTAITPDGSERSSGTWRFHTTFNMEQPVAWGTLKWGAWARADKYDYRLEAPFLGVNAEGEFVLTGGGYIGTEWHPTQGLLLHPSVGAMVSSLGTRISIEPRLRLSWHPGASDRTTLTAAAGLYRQLAAGITDERDAGSAFVAWIPAPEGRLLQATHALLGWHQRILPGLTAHVEGYYKRFRDLPVARWTVIRKFNTSLARADGRAYGADLRVEYQRGPVYLSASYSWGWVTYWAAGDALGAWTGGEVVRYHPPHDQRHSLGLVTSVDAGLFEANVHWQFSSGLPFTQVYGFDTRLELRGLTSLPTESVGLPRLFYRRAYNARLPAYHRLDVSLQRTFELSPVMDLTVEAGAINLYDRANVFYIDIYTLERVNQLPLIPYVGLRLDIR